MKLGQVVLTWRKAHGLGQKEVAAQIGISRKQYARIEEGHVRPRAYVLKRICEIMNIEEDFHSQSTPPRRGTRSK